MQNVPISQSVYWNTDDDERNDGTDEETGDEKSAETRSQAGVEKEVGDDLNNSYIHTKSRYCPTVVGASKPSSCTNAESPATGLPGRA